MTSRERWLAAARLEPIDRLPFWPKLTASYPRAQKTPFDSMTVGELHDWIGSDRHVSISNVTMEKGNHSSLTMYGKNGVRRTVFKAQHGSCERVDRWDVSSQSYHPVSFPIKTKTDVELMIDFYADRRVELDDIALEEAVTVRQRLGETASTMSSMGESPLMHFVEWLAGVENAHLLLFDHRSLVEELFEKMHRVNVRVAELHAEFSPADFLYFTENTSTTLISPDQYVKYCRKHVDEYGRIVTEAEKIFALHMCGHLKVILPVLSETPAHVFEAFTSPPVGNTTLLDGRTCCPEKCLVGGTNATTWVKPADEIIEEIRLGLDQLPHRRGLVITSAGVMSPICEPDTIRQVGDWVKEYPVE